jgi:hypothetical protein
MIESFLSIYTTSSRRIICLRCTFKWDTCLLCKLTDVTIEMNVQT